MAKPFISHEQNAPSFKAGDATLLQEILHPQNHSCAIGYSIAKAELAVGTSSLPHQLVGSETYYILSGEGIIYIDDQNFELTTGSIAWVPPHAQQWVKNTGDTSLVFICIVEPFWQESEENINT